MECYQELSSTCLNGSAAFISAVIVFCGSVWLLLALVMGPKLAYLVTASVTLGFVLIMALVWSYGTPLGPVGDLPDWSGEAAGAVGEPLEFGPAADYPDSPWQPPDPEIQEQVTQASELETSAAAFLEEEIAADRVQTFESAGDAVVDSEQTRLLEQDGDTFGAVTFEVLEVEGDEGLEEDPEAVEGEPTVVVMSYDPGNPSYPARRIAVGTFIVFAGHLFFLSRSEKKAKKNNGNGNGNSTTA